MRLRVTTFTYLAQNVINQSVDFTSQLLKRVYAAAVICRKQKS